MKIIDTDQLFGEFLMEYVKENPTESESTMAEKMPELYVEFSHKPCAELDGKTPEEYYLKADGKELLNALKEHVKQGVPVPDYLCEGIVKNTADEDMLALLNDEDELVSYAVNLFGEKESVKCYKKYVSMLRERICSEDILDSITEQLSKNPELVKEDIIGMIEDGDDTDRLFYLEILCHCDKDQRIFNFIMKELLAHPTKLQLYLSYVRKYGDERALDTLYEIIEDPKIDYVDFKELVSTIESLGGVYDKKRDFSNDPNYKKLHQSS